MEYKNVLEEELESGRLYELVLGLSLEKIKGFRLNAKTEKEKEFYSKLYHLVLQSRQTEAIEKGVF